MTYGVLSVAQVYAILHLREVRPLYWYGPAAANIYKAGLWALATPLIVRWALRFPFGAGSILRPSMIHGITAVAVLFVDTYADLLFYWLLRGDPPANLVIAALQRADVVLLYYFIVVLATHVVRYYDTARRAQIATAELNTALIESQLQLLRNQIRPHFLFNALNVISELTREDPIRAGIMIEKLGSMLRITLDHGSRQLVPLRAEIELVRLYLDLQQTRFEEWLEYEIHVPGELEDAAVPAFVLQPIVENAVQHGVLPAGRRCTIVVAAQHVGDLLELTVCDDGVGIGARPQRKGVGLSNTEARLQRLYSRFRLELEPLQPSGTRVLIELPYDASPIDDLRTMSALPPVAERL